MKAAIACIVFLAGLLGGCAMSAPAYSPAVANVESASRLKGKVSVGKFDFREPGLDGLSARGMTFTSPVSGSYGAYIAEAVRGELQAAGRHDPSSPKVLTGTVEKNSLSAAGINTNDAQIAVRFRLTEGGRATYDKVLESRHEWESSFLGGVAIPRAVQNWVVTLQKLFALLYADPEFSDSTRP